jgi:hypothetical protein
MSEKWTAESAPSEEKKTMSDERAPRQDGIGQRHCVSPTVRADGRQSDREQLAKASVPIDEI